VAQVIERFLTRPTSPATQFEPEPAPAGLKR
jgi:hypothetical protein